MNPESVILPSIVPKKFKKHLYIIRTASQRRVHLRFIDLMSLYDSKATKSKNADQYSMLMSWPTRVPFSDRVVFCSKIHSAGLNSSRVTKPGCAYHEGLTQWYGRLTQGLEVNHLFYIFINHQMTLIICGYTPTMTYIGTITSRTAATLLRWRHRIKSACKGECHTLLSYKYNINKSGCRA